MSEPDTAHNERRSDDCTTTGSFSDHGIEDAGPSGRASTRNSPGKSVPGRWSARQTSAPGTGNETETRPLVDVTLRVNGGWRTVTASITDRSEMTYPMLLGRDVLEDYMLDISQRVEE